MELEPRLEFEPRTQGSIDCLDFSSNGEHLMSGSSDGGLRLWKVTGKHVCLAKTSKRAFVDCRSIAEGRSALYCQEARKNEGRRSILKDQPMYGLYDFLGQENRLLFEEFNRYLTPFYPLAISDSRELAAFGFGQCGVGLFRTGSTTDPEILWDTEESDFQPEAIAFLSNGEQLAIACSDGLIRFWALAEKQFLTEIESGFAHVDRLAVSPGGEELAIADPDGHIVVRRIDNGQRLQFLDDHRGRRIRDLKYFDGGQRLLTLSYNSRTTSLRFWSRGEEGSGPFREWRPEWPSVRSVAVSPDEQLIATGHLAGRICLWTLDDVAAFAESQHARAEEEESSTRKAEDLNGELEEYFPSDADEESQAP